MTTYPFRQGIDYGPRTRGTLGLGFHMTEGAGGIGDVDYLARKAGETVAAWHTRIRGVSAHVVILADGQVWQMVDFDHAAGSFDPAARNPATTGYYQGAIVRDVLGPAYVDPNACSIVTEIAGRRDVGPTIAQVHAAVAWSLDMKGRYPSLRGAFGHHDQTDEKGCPGTTPNMRAIFDGIGGHGLWEEPMKLEPITAPTPALITVAKGAAFLELDGTTVLGHAQADLAPRSSPYGAGTTHRAMYASFSGVLRTVLVVPASIAPLPPPVTTDSAVAAERERVKSKAIELIGAIE